jgi:hypothetical protein
MKPAILGMLALWAPFGLNAQDLKETVRKALLTLNDSDKHLSDYGFVRHTEQKEFKPDGSVKSHKTTLFKREMRDGLLVTHPVERDGKPLSPAEKKEIEAALQKRLADSRRLSPEQRRKQSEEARKKDREADAWMNEVPEAFDFKLVGEEILAGRPALVVDATPRPGYKPSNMRAKVLPKMRGRLWIDKAEGQLAKADAEVFEEVNVAFGIAGHIDKGTRFHIQRTRLADGIWAGTYEHARFAARLMMFKNFNAEVVNRTSSYVRLRNTVETAALTPAN